MSVRVGGFGPYGAQSAEGTGSASTGERESCARERVAAAGTRLRGAPAAPTATRPAAAAPTLVGRGASDYGPAVPPARFVTDSSLEFLARRLRFLGYDVLTLRGARLEDLFERARVEGRTVLTTSARRPRRYADVPALGVARGDPAGSLRALAAAHEPAGQPFSRCAECDTALQERHAFEASGEVPGRVLRGARSLHYCPTCGKWYWDGTHVAKIRAWLEQALGRPLGTRERARPEP